MRVIDYLRCYMNITAHRPAVMLQGVELTDVDAVIPRIGASHTFYGTAVVRQFEMMGTSPPTSPRPSAEGGTSCGPYSCWPATASACR